MKKRNIYSPVPENNLVHGRRAAKISKQYKRLEKRKN